MRFEAVIGLEVHAQLLTESKIFCGCSVKFGAAPNTQACPVCSGMPGTLPVLNKKAVELALRVALATGCEIRENSVFARKNYFYPDLPKGYQISQYERPLCENGSVDIRANGGARKIRIRRIHLEEDAGKSIHDRGGETLVDFNRCGTPLAEIVTEPDLRSPEEASLYLTKLKQILRYLDVSDCNMEEGSLRCDANVSVRPAGEAGLGTKTELKNMNSFKQVEKAIQYEIKRQVEIVENGGKVVQETLLWDANAGEARPMRQKEGADDYRYFPEPDLMTVSVDEGWIDRVRKALPELPEVRCGRFKKQYALSPYDAEVLTESRDIADFYEKEANATKHYKALANWVSGEVLGALNEKKINISELPLPPAGCAELINMIDEGLINGKIAKSVFAEMLASGKPPREIVNTNKLEVISDNDTLLAIVRSTMGKNPVQVKQYRAGKTKVMGFFVGEVMKATNGKADPKIVNELLEKGLSDA